MRVTNEPEDPGRASGPFAQLIRLQSEFQTRLAEETLRYLRHLQGTLGPAAPGTVLMPVADFQLVGQGAPGARAHVALELHNLQRVHCMVTPQVTPLVSSSGVTWFPETEPASLSRLLSPDEVETVAFSLVIPGDLPEDVYRGALLLVGFRDNALPLEVVVGEGTGVATSAGKRASGSAKGAAGRARSRAKKQPGVRVRRGTPGEGTKKKTTTTTSTGKKTAAKKATAGKGGAKRASAKKAPAGRTARKEPTTEARASKKAAPRSSAKKKTAQRSSAKKKTAQRSSAKKKVVPRSSAKKAAPRSRTKEEGGST